MYWGNVLVYRARAQSGISTHKFTLVSLKECSPLGTVDLTSGQSFKRSAPFRGLKISFTKVQSMLIVQSNGAFSQMVHFLEILAHRSDRVLAPWLVVKTDRAALQWHKGNMKIHVVWYEYWSVATCLAIPCEHRIMRPSLALMTVALLPSPLTEIRKLLRLYGSLWCSVSVF